MVVGIEGMGGVEGVEGVGGVEGVLRGHRAALADWGLHIFWGGG